VDFFRANMLAFLTLKKANADATLGLLNMLAPIRRLVDRIKGS
jgi:hypothetical protein